MSVIAAIATALKSGGIQAAYNFPGFYSQELFAELGGTHISTNEKIAYETAWGRSQAGQPAVVTFKNVGLNDAADPFINSHLTGVGAGLVVAVFDDIELAGSQAILDSRHYFKHVGGLWLEPFDWASSILLAEAAPMLSHMFNIPVVLRFTNKTLQFRERAQGANVQLSAILALAKKHAAKLAQLPSEPLVHPANGFEHQQVLIEKNQAISTFVTELHLLIYPDGIYGAVSVGTTTENTDTHIFTLPVPRGTRATEVLEVGDAVVANELRLQHSSTDFLSKTIGYNDANRSRVIIADRYERLFELLKPRFRYIVGDLGEYTKDTLQTLTHCLCFGSSLSVAMGMAEAGESALAITGDGALYHSGKNCLTEAQQRNAPLHVVLLDNGGMQGTGGQQVPGVLPRGSTILTCDSNDSSEVLRATIDQFCRTAGQVILHVHVR